jgi:hypothetical protein
VSSAAWPPLPCAWTAAGFPAVRCRACYACGVIPVAVASVVAPAVVVAARGGVDVRPALGSTARPCGTRPAADASPALPSLPPVVCRCVRTVRQPTFPGRRPRPYRPSAGQRNYGTGRDEGKITSPGMLPRADHWRANRSTPELHFSTRFTHTEVAGVHAVSVFAEVTMLPGGGARKPHDSGPREAEDDAR